ncbi:MAG: hypothetical protein HY556_02510 [Euryarchaeota archaeon]|nr:hypothetical protein [Euryarchaeota archaeon]
MRRLDAREAAICFKLYRHGRVGAGHILIDNLVKGFPSHELGEIRDSVEKLIRDGVLVPKSTAHGKAVYVNTRLRLDVYDRIREHKDFAWLPK